jgi:hypothetical protein
MLNFEFFCGEIPVLACVSPQSHRTQEVTQFRQTLIRLCSLMHGSALDAWNWSSYLWHEKCYEHVGTSLAELGTNPDSATNRIQKLIS